MKINDLKVGVLAAALLAAALVSSPATANTEQESAFAALQNVQAQSLTPAEMQAIAGELNAADIAATLTARATKYAAYPKLAAYFNALAAYYYTLANAHAINAKLVRLGVYTP